jgi:hypothetical protein
MRVPEAAGGMEMGLFDAALLMEEAGRTLASGPLAEALVATRLLGLLGGAAVPGLLDRAISGEAIVTIALHDMAGQPRQWIAGGAVCDAIIARSGDDVVLLTLPGAARRGEDNLAGMPVAELDLGNAGQHRAGSVAPKHARRSPQESRSGSFWSPWHCRDWGARRCAWARPMPASARLLAS